MWRLRKRLGPTRFFVAGEYGKISRRPHFHAILFGQGFPGGTLVGSDIRAHPILENLWPHGFSSVGAVTYGSAHYVAAYCVKKLATSPDSDAYRYLDPRTGEILPLVPEFCHMSLRPGLGYPWFQKYWADVYQARDGVVQMGGFTVPAPRYYDKLLSTFNSDLHDYKQFERYAKSALFLDDTTPARLAVRETCAYARYNHKERRSL